VSSPGAGSVGGQVPEGRRCPPLARARISDHHILWHLDAPGAPGAQLACWTAHVGIVYCKISTPQVFDADPKTDAGKRTVTIPPHVLPILAEHMITWAGTDRLFVGRGGRPMRGDAIRQAFTRARRKAGMPGFRFHDLRHTGQTLAASTGATTKDLMRRLGHASPAAANRYLHAVDGRDAEIASALSDLAAHGDPARLPKSIVIKH
jgi:integrase